jgi:hypothetical protein
VAGSRSRELEVIDKGKSLRRYHRTRSLILALQTLKRELKFRGNYRVQVLCLRIPDIMRSISVQ